MAPLPQVEERAQVLLDVAQDEAVTSVRRKNDDTEMDITPMIDITFLLLIFFVVSNKMDNNTAIPVPTARNGNTVKMQDAIVISMNTQGENAKIYLGDGTNSTSLVTGDTPLAQEEEVMEYVTEEISKDPSKKYIVIKASGDLHHRDVSRVAKAAGAAAVEASEGSSMYVAVMEKS